MEAAILKGYNILAEGKGALGSVVEVIESWPNDPNMHFSKQLPKVGSVFYIGFDPTAPSLHVGNLLGLIVATHLRLAGYQPLLLVGGATARIGDPSFRSSAKSRLQDEKIEAFSENIKKQISFIMDIGLKRARYHFAHSRSDLPGYTVLDNYDWQRDVKLLDFMDQVGRWTRLSPMLSRDSVQRRLQSEAGMSFAELIYQLLQGYDFYHLFRNYGCRLQIGGSDQWGNMMAGVDLISKLATDDKDSRIAELSGSASAVTFPLLTTEEGVKMGKSAGNAVWLDPQMTSPFDMYQYFLRFSDADALKLLAQLTFLQMQLIRDISAQHNQHPEQRLAQKTLAKEVVAFVHGTELSELAGLASQYLFEEYASALGSVERRQFLIAMLTGSQRYIHCDVGGGDGGEVTLLQALHNILPQEAYSKTKLRHLAQSGGIYVNGQRQTDLLVAASRVMQGPTFVRIGKLEHYLVEVDEGRGRCELDSQKLR